MPVAMVYEFEGVTAAQYAIVSRYLGIDPESGEGQWPTGLLSHAAGTADDGTFIVSEVWSSREDQAGPLLGLSTTTQLVPFHDSIRVLVTV